jgi:hypothetical protein
MIWPQHHAGYPGAAPSHLREEALLPCYVRKVQFPANMEVVTAGAQGLVGHNDYGIVNIGFRESQMRGRHREIPIEYA